MQENITEERISEKSAFMLYPMPYFGLGVLAY